MAYSTLVPLFGLSGFGPLGLPLDPAAYGMDLQPLIAGSLAGPREGGGTSLYAESQEGTASLARVLGGGRGPSGRSPLMAASSKPPRSSDLPESGRHPVASSRRVETTTIRPAEGTYLLRFTSGKYKGGEFPLRADRPVMIGRSADMDLVLDESMVTRRHAKISLEGGQLVIEDLGSTQGTCVNGQKVKKSVLKVGDRILIGTNLLQLTLQEGDGPIPGKEEVRVQLEQAARAAENAPKSSTLSGNIDEGMLFDLLQLFQTQQKNGVLLIHGNQEGKIHLRQGQIVYAEITGSQGADPKESFVRMLAWKKGRFELLPPENRKFPVELQERTDALLMDGLRLLDEMRERERKLNPSLFAPLALAVTAPAFRDLAPEELDVLQLVLVHGSAQAAIDHASSAEIDAGRIAAELIRKGYLAVGEAAEKDLSGAADGEINFGDGETF